jgi:hypothetical protein
MRIPENAKENEVRVLEKLAVQIAEIIKDYENVPLFRKIDKTHVLSWVNQFEEDDREFLLSELLYILPASYLSKNDTIHKLEAMFEYFRNQFQFASVTDLLDHCSFRRCQLPHKSQSILLDFIDGIIQDKYDRSVDDCGTKGVKYWFYIDDVLASGGTFEREITKEIKDYGYDEFKASEITIIALFFYLHSWGYGNRLYRLKDKVFDNYIENKLKFYRFYEIENNPDRNWFISSQSHNHAYPRAAGQPEEVFQYLESLEHANYNEKFAFRAEEEPKKEVFFSSEAARARYESILLLKGIELINSIEKEPSKGLRPLGFTAPSHKTFGLGSHCFTWRNISNTCPLVFWWESNGWYPLLPVKFRG